MKAIDKIDNYELKLLSQLYGKCKPGQKRFFWRMYNQYGLELKYIPKDKRKWAIQQCENTVIKNGRIHA